MKDAKGYTLVEMLVGMVILSLAIAGALSFFILQSREGFESFRVKRIDESVTLAEAILARDIMEAGFGVTEYPELAISIVNSANEGRDALYVNYSSYVSLEPAPERGSASVIAVMKENGVFYDSVTSYQGYIALGTGLSQFTLNDIPLVAGTNNGNIGALLARDSSGNVLVRQVKVGESTAAAGSLTGTQKWTFKLESSITADFGAPAVSYKWVKTAVGGEQIGGLWRNRGAESAPWGVPLLGGEPYFQVNDFQVDYQFADGAWATGWDPANNRTPTTLKLVRAMIGYQTRPREMHKWGPVHRRIVTASPRNLVLTGD
jgi:prepilin-type N-terminal cleavage/methylation domain-containing protein